MREIGGYFELEKNDGSLFHDQAIALNFGCAAMEYLVRAKNIQKLYFPYFFCSSVTDYCEKCGIEYEFYHIDESFRPVFEKKLGDGEWLFLVNFYGQLTNDQIKAYHEQYGRIIADNTHAFFQMPVEGVDTIYNCRKYFGVPDGAFLYTDASLPGLERDESFERISHLFGRFERTANEFYQDFITNNEILISTPMRTMSKLTENMMRGLNFDRICRTRTENFAMLHKSFSAQNPLKLIVPEGAFMYPLYLENGWEIRKKLQSMKIYIPTLWPGVFDVCSEDDLEYRLAENILPIPVDQRYGAEDMAYLVTEIQKLIGG